MCIFKRSVDEHSTGGAGRKILAAFAAHRQAPAGEKNVFSVLVRDDECCVHLLNCCIYFSSFFIFNPLNFLIFLFSYFLIFVLFGRCAEIAAGDFGDACLCDQAQGSVDQVSYADSHQQSEVDVLRPAGQLQRRCALVCYQARVDAFGEDIVCVENGCVCIFAVVTMSFGGCSVSQHHSHSFPFRCFPFCCSFADFIHFLSRFLCLGEF